MPESVINESDLALDRYDGNIFVLTMRKAPVSSPTSHPFRHKCIAENNLTRRQENRINSQYAQKLIAAYNKVRKILGENSEGAVITKGNDAKFFCTVSYAKQLKRPSEWFSSDTR